ncbi:MAG: hypothetical protein KGS09_20910 [Nitrospirae bacterium]|nr:hypothetical protein [Nitrospirota bacterium]
MAHTIFSESLHRSWDNYDRDARKRVGQSSIGALALIGEFSVALQNAVEDIEESKLFSSLLESVQHEVASKGYHKGHISFWSNALRNVLRRSGYYSRIARSRKPNSKVELHRIMVSFDRREETVTYMAPMEYVWLEQANLKFPTFTIEKFSKEQLDHIFDAALNKLYFPRAVIDIATLSDYWFVVVKEKRPIFPLGKIEGDLGSIGKVDISYSPFPVLEKAFQRLVLFDWQQDYVRHKKPGERPAWQGWLGFSIPFVVRLSDNLLRAPQQAPIISELETMSYHVPLTGGELDGPAHYINLNGEETQALARSIKETDRLIRNIESAQEVWPFLVRALGFQVKGFFSKGLEQLLWHITVLEALFGEDIPGMTKRLARRTAAVTGQSEAERKKIKERFEELYDFRSRLVHGDKFKKQIWGGHLRDARDMSRQSLLWFINLASKVFASNRKKSLSALPTRNELLALIDLKPDTITRFAKIIRSEPSTFPAISSWNGPTMKHEKQK